MRIWGKAPEGRTSANVVGLRHARAPVENKEYGLALWLIVGGGANPVMTDDAPVATLGALRLNTLRE